MRRSGFAAIDSGALKRAQKGLEALFMLLTVAYAVFLFNGLAAFALPADLDFEAALLRVMAVVALARLALIGPRRKEPWIGLGMAAVYYLCHRAIGYRIVYFMAVLTLGYIDMDYRRVLRVWLATLVAGFATMVIAALAGGIVNIVYYRDGLRSSWGAVYPTDFSSMLLYILLLAWVLWQDAPDWAMLLMSLVSLAAALFITLSRNAMICSVLFSGMVAYRWFERKVVEGRGRFKGLKKGCDWLTTLAFPLCAAAFFGMVWLYARNTGVGLKLDGLLSERLKQCLAAFREHGLTPFGTDFIQKGNGLSVFPQKEINFIDSSYMLMLLRYGWVTTLMLGAVWVGVTRRAIRCGDRRLALAMALIAFHSISEHHFIELHFNPLLLVPLTLFGRPAQAIRDPRRGRAGRIASGVALAALIALIALAGPRALTWLRTVFGAEGWRGGGLSAIPALLIALALAAALAAATRALFLLVNALLNKGKIPAVAPAMLAAAVGVCLGIAIWGNGVIATATGDNAERLAADADGVARVLDAAQGKVYADALPELYRRRFDGISPTIYIGEDLARHRGVTVLADAEPEQHIFIQTGFRFAQISKDTAVYTDDPAVIAALADAGCEVTDFWSTEVEVDLEALAKLNRLPLTGSGMVLSGPRKSQTKGPYADLYGGLNVLDIDLQLPKVTSDEAGRVCRVRVCAYWGEDELAAVDVMRDDFDESGHAVIEVPFTTGYARATEFFIYDEPGRPVFIQRIRYHRLQAG